MGLRARGTGNSKARGPWSGAEAERGRAQMVLTRD